MPTRGFLGGFELLVLLALIRLGDDAYGVPISETIEEHSAREVSLGSVYITLGRLEQKGLVSSTLGEPTAERGGRAKTYFHVTATGLRAVRQARLTLMRLWQGVPQLEGGSGLAEQRLPRSQRRGLHGSPGGPVSRK
jgi:PadR family transcriptional regulator PadR